MIILTLYFLQLNPVISQCEQNPCENGGTCKKHALSYTCDCPPGYNGSLCQNGKHKTKTKTKALIQWESNQLCILWCSGKSTMVWHMDHSVNCVPGNIEWSSTKAMLAIFQDLHTGHVTRHLWVTEVSSAHCVWTTSLIAHTQLKFFYMLTVWVWACTCMCSYGTRL